MKKTIEISTDEAKSLRDFVEAVKELDIVECVYLLPYLDEDDSKEVISVITLRNNDLVGDPSVDYEAFRERVRKQLEMLNMVVDGYQKEYAEARMSFIHEGTDDYSLALMHHREIIAERQLVSGTIIFDRNERLSTNREIAKKYVPPFDNVFKIENPEILRKSDLSLD